MTTHELKCWPEFFEAILDGSKSFDVRHDDRGYAVGDVLVMKEYDIHKQRRDDLTAGYTGREKAVEVTYLMRGGGCPAMHEVPRTTVVMGIKRLALKDGTDAS